MTGQNWANANNFIIRARHEITRAHESMENADIPPSTNQQRAINNNIQKLKKDIRALRDTWSAS